MTSIRTLHTLWQNNNIFIAEMKFQSILNVINRTFKPKIHAPVLLNLLNSLQKTPHKILRKPRILSLFFNFVKNSIKHEHSSKIHYIYYI